MTNDKVGDINDNTGTASLGDGKIHVVAAEKSESANESAFDMDENIEFLSDDVVAEDTQPAAEDPSQAVVDFSEILDDREKVNKGVVVVYRGKTTVQLARMNNAAYQARLSKLYTANKHEIDKRTPEADKLAEHCTLQAIAECVVKGWNNMMLNGEVLPYSPKAALYLLKNSEDFRRFVQQQATLASNYYKQTTEADKEHLKKLLIGA